jgi:hypothetical protein
VHSVSSNYVVSPKVSVGTTGMGTMAVDPDDSLEFAARAWGRRELTDRSIRHLMGMFGFSPELTRCPIEYGQLQEGGTLPVGQMMLPCGYRSCGGTADISFVMVGPWPSEQLSRSSSRRLPDDDDVVIESPDFRPAALKALAARSFERRMKIQPARRRPDRVQ